MVQSSIFYWNYISNKVWGKYNRKLIKEYSYSNRVPNAICHLHTRPVSSWCNTTLAPPKFLLK